MIRCVTLVFLLILGSPNLLFAQTDGYTSRMLVIKNDKYGYLDETGKEVIPCEYEELKSFSEGLAAARKGDHWTYIDVNGKVVIDLKERYTVCNNFQDGMAYVTTGEAKVSRNKLGRRYTDKDDIRFINSTGQEVLKLDRQQLDYSLENPNALKFSDGLLRISTNYLPRSARKLDGYLNKEGKLVIPYRLNYPVGDFSEGLAKVPLRKYSEKKREPPQRYGFIDKSGDWAILPIYSEVQDFKHGLSLINITTPNGKYSSSWVAFFIDKNGKKLFPDSIETKQHFHQTSLGVFVKSAKGVRKHAIADTLGNLLTPFVYDALIPGDIWGGKLDKKILFINHKGEVVLRTTYDSTNGFKQGLAIVINQISRTEWQAGVINMEGEEVIPPENSYRYKIEGGIILEPIPKPNKSLNYYNRYGKKLDLAGYEVVKNGIQWVKRVN